MHAGAPVTARIERGQSEGLISVQDPRRGLLARYTVTAGDASALAAALGRYTFAAEGTPS